jgi:hypothetical protein
MDILTHILEHLPGDPLQQILWVGADTLALDAMAARRDQDVLLVQGDAAEAADMVQRTVGTDARLAVRAAVVTPNGGDVTWHCYSFSDLNGPLEVTGLGRVFPRLYETSRHQVGSLPFAELVDEFTAELNDESTATPSRRALVLDVPGQERALLEALSAEQLRRFGIIVFRGYSERRSNNGSTAGESAAVLERAPFWRPWAASGQAHPLWSVHAFSFDLAAFSRHRDSALIESLRAQVAELEVLPGQMDALHRAHDATRQESTLLRAELLARQEELFQLRAHAEQQAAALASKYRELAEQSALRAALETQSLALRKAHDSNLLELESTRKQLTEALVWMQRASEASASAAEHQQVATRLQAIVQERELEYASSLAASEAKLLAQQQTIESLQARLADLEATLSTATSKLRELVDAKDLLLQLEHKLASADAEIIGLRSEVDTSKLAHSNAVATQKELSTRLAAAQQERELARQERDQHAKTATARESQLKELTARVGQLEGETADAQARLDLMHQELARAEGQLELLRELLLREPTL